MYRILIPAAGLLVAILALGGLSALAAWLALLFSPGLALYMALARRRDAVEAAGCALALSPVIVVAVSVPSMLAGIDAATAGRSLIVVSAVVLAVATTRARPARQAPLTPAQVAILVGFVVLLCGLTSYLPLSDEWWRIRSDAWAHRAYVAEVADFGVPPMDPYFVGFPLQYMWAYHALIHTVSSVVRIDPFFTMALLNVQALAGLIVATFLFAGTLTRGFARRMLSAVTVTLGMNAAFWVFLPVKLMKAFTGDTRGFDELSRQLSLVPFTFRRAMQFMQIFHNKEFFLDKYMVATAFGLGLCLMAATWWSATEYIRSGRRAALVAAGLAMLGLLSFHTMVASVMLTATMGALAILFLLRHRIDGYSLRRSLVLAGALIAAFVIASPYVYSVLHSKDGGVGDSSLRLAVLRLVGVAISVAFVAVLAGFQRWIVRDRSMPARFVVVAAVIVTVVALVLPLPGANNFDKPPFFVFFPLATVGAWSLVDLYKRRAALAVVIGLLAFVPVTTLALAASFNTGPDWSVGDDERALAGWIRQHTERDAVLLDDEDHVPFVVLGPRRHLWGRIAFADSWHYDRSELSRRYHAWRAVYGTAPFDAVTLRVLGSVDTNLYVIVRTDRHEADCNVLTHPEYFTKVHSEGGLAVYRVDRERCRADAASGRFPEVSAGALLDELGLD